MDRGAGRRGPKSPRGWSMNLTPLDIRKATFRKVLRGVDTEEVGAFLDVVAENFERILQDNAKLSERVQGLEERVRQYQGMERFLQDSMLTAERLVAESRDNSRQDAERTLEEANQRAERILEDARDRLRSLNREVRELASRKELYVERFRSMLESQRLFLDEHQQDLDEIDSIGQDLSELLTHEAGNRDEQDELESGQDEARAASPSASREPQDSLDFETPPQERYAGVEAESNAEDAGGAEDEPEESEQEAAVESGGGDARRPFFPPRVRRQGFFDMRAEGERE
ncbi:MAG: DivIVA domain-containing protein [Candidatus Eisenbacteria bacterium]|nr:DivIVA domain-containing protein [Candidatus Eisenbacteria bacterium]